MVDEPVDGGRRRHGIAEVFILPPFWNALYAERVGHSRAVKRFQGVRERFSRACHWQFADL